MRPAATSEHANPETPQRPRSPELNGFNLLGRVLHAIGAVTRSNASRILSEKPIRDLSDRRERARLFEEWQREGRKNQNPAQKRSARKRILDEAHVRDEILERYLDQKDVRYSGDDFGEISARYADVRPSPESADHTKPPIVLIPGISNDLLSVDALVKELAFSGRRVIVIGHPDSQMGTISSEFADAVDGSPGYVAHAKFFQDAINQVLPEGSPIELWGFSAGGPISAEMLTNNPEFSKRVQRLVLANPAGAVKQNLMQMGIGLLREVKNILQPIAFSAYSLVMGRDVKNGTPPEADGQRLLKEKVLFALARRLGQPTDWNALRVSEGGTIVVGIGLADDVTKAPKAFHGVKNGRQAHPQEMKVVEFPGHTHNGVLIDSANFIKQIGAA